MPIIVVN